MPRINFRVLSGHAFPIFLLLTVNLTSVRAEGGPRLSLSNLQLQSTVCPDTRTCFVVGTQLTSTGTTGGLVNLTSHDGGASWIVGYKQSNLTSGPLSCPGTRQCYELGTSFTQTPPSARLTLLHTTDGGQSWHQGNIGPRGLMGFFSTSLVCPSATECYLANMIVPSGGANGAARPQALLMVTRDSGKSWTQIHMSGPQNLGLRAMACATAASCDVGGTAHETSCFQAGAILHTGDGGSNWIRQFGDCATSITALSCPIARTCYAAGSYGEPDAAGNQLVLRTIDSGASWKVRLEGPIDSASNTNSTSISGIACPTPQICFLSLANEIVATTDGGATWTIQTSVDNTILNSISCATSRVCVSVGWVYPPVSDQGSAQPHVTGLILRTVDGGKTWMKP